MSSPKVTYDEKHGGTLTATSILYPYDGKSFRCVPRGCRRQKRMKMSDETLRGIFTEVGKRYGYEDIDAKFTVYRDFKVKWRRSYKWIEFDVSDYLMDAPEDVMTEIADTIYAKIRGDREVCYGEKVCGWVVSDEFVDSKQMIYAGRFRGFVPEPKGKHRDLSESYRRLVDAGLVRDDPKILLGWVTSGFGRRCGNSSVLMKVVCMNGMLDSPEIPEVVLDYCLYAYLCHIQMGYSPDMDDRKEEYRRILSRFPFKGTAEDEMRRISLKL